MNNNNNNNSTTQRHRRRRTSTRKRTRQQQQQSTQRSRTPRTTPHDVDFGDNFAPKAKGIFHLTTGNISNFDVDRFDNQSVAELKSFLRTTESDTHCIQEVGINWKAYPRDSRLKDWFRTENELRTIAAHNKHGHHRKRQWGGTAILAMGQATSAIVEQGVDETGLGRWSWLLFKGSNNHRTRIISAYRPCKSQKQQFRTVYNQHRQHFRSLKREGCPRQLFVEDLHSQLIQWRESGERLIVCIDGNEDVRRGALQAMFSSPELGMTEVISSRHASLPTAVSFCAGDRQGR